MNDAMRVEWTRLKQAAARAEPTIVASLRGPAADSAIASVAELLGVPLPDDVVASFRIHDGQSFEGESLNGEWHQFSLDEATRAWRMQSELLAAGEFADRSLRGVDPGVRPIWWEPCWFPLLGNEAGDYVVVDLAPVAGGCSGQLVEVRHDSRERRIVAPSFGAWLKRTADEWEARAEASAIVARTASPGGSKAMVAQSPPSLATLLSLIGRPLADPEVAEFVRSQPLVRRAGSSGDFDLSCQAFGYDIACAGGCVQDIEVRFSDLLQGGIFGGALVGGVTPADTRAELERKLGAPLATGGFKTTTGNPMGWLRFAITGKPVTFVYRTNHSGISFVHLGR
ncbi:MAG: SMI1/KNR4 family protein [Tepidisphaeraceae bacterium]